MLILKKRSRLKRKNKQTDFTKTVKEWLGKLITPATETETEKIKSHFHRVEGTTSRAKGHMESVVLYTGKPVAAKESHVHQYSGAISEGEQPHYVEGMTGPAVITGDDHYHKISGRTTKDGNHSHKFKINTSGAIRNKKQLRYKDACTKPAHSMPVAVVEEETER